MSQPLYEPGESPFESAMKRVRFLEARLEKLECVALAARKLTKYCPAKEEHGTEEDCKIYGCKEVRKSLAALDASEYWK